MSAKTKFTVFTKPWEMALPDLGKFVKSMGFDGIELPVRPGYQVEPDTMERTLPEAVKILADFGLKIGSVAAAVDERTITICGNSDIPIIRICSSVKKGETYTDFKERTQREFDSLVPILDKNNVTLGLQNHCGRFVCNAMGIRDLIENYDSKHIGAVLDFAHCALDGEPTEVAIDIVWSHLCMVNLKNAFWRRVNGPEAGAAQWEDYWTTGRQGLASWPEAAEELKKRDYKGDVCLTAEYTDKKAVDRLIKEDIKFVKELFEE